jgi:predicted Rossmann fold flavoprotein
MHYDLAILGAGAAGMMAAVAAAEQTFDPATGKSCLRIAIFEKNTQPGVKVLVCGGGRCNFTNAGSVDFLIEQFGRNGRFLTPALHHLDNDGLRAWFAAQNVPSHEEHDGKIYPDSNQAKSIVNALVIRMRTLGVEIHTGPTGTITSVTHPSSLIPHPFQFSTATNDSHSAHTLLLAVGGMSYQRMGTTGDGYTFAQSLGHTIVTPRPAIVALLVKEEWVKDLQGLAVQDVEVKILVTGPLPTLATGRPTPTINDMLFTHFGLSGPAILNPSEIVAELLEKFDTVTLRIDFARQLSYDEVAAKLRTWQQHDGKKLVRRMLADSHQSAPALFLPTRLAEKFCELELIPPEQPCATLTAAQIHRLTERLKNSRFTVHATRGFKEAMVTAGGIKLSEVDPRTLESKIVKNLFLTGEVLDLTGPSGGYNLQLAFSTGHLAGTTIGQRAMEMGQGDTVTR